MTEEITEVRWVNRNDQAEILRLIEDGYRIEEIGGHHSSHSLLASKTFKGDEDG